jgi:hypothetical protein
MFPERNKGFVATMQQAARWDRAADEQSHPDRF